MLWLLVAPLLIEIDTRVPRAKMKWQSIGSGTAFYNGEWWLTFRIFFYHKTIRFSEIASKPHKKRIAKKRTKKPLPASRALKKIAAVLRTFHIKEWQLAIDSDNYVLNAKLYPLNYLPHTAEHIHINFTDENYLVLKLSNRPWKILYAFIR